MLSGTTEAATAEEAAAVPVVVPEQDAMICRESVDENQEPLLEESPSPSLLRSRASPLLMRVGSGKVALSGTLWHEQSCDQRCTNTMTRKRPLSAGDDVSTDSGSTPTLEMSPTSTHFSPSTLNK